MNKVEKYIQDYTRRCSNELDYKEDGSPYTPWLTPDHAKAVAEIAREEVIEKACEWLSNWNAYRVCLEGQKEWFIEKFRKAMEEEE